MNTTLRMLLMPGLLLALLMPALAQGQLKPGLQLESEDLVLAVRFEPATARAGEHVKLILEATTTPGWHAYGFLETTNVPVSLSHENIEFGGLEPVGEPEIPPGDEKETLGMLSYPLPEYFEVTQVVKVPVGMAAGEAEVSGTFDYQVCDETSCKAPAEAAFSGKLTIEAGDVRAEYADAPSAGSGGEGETGEQGEGAGAAGNGEGAGAAGNGEGGGVGTAPAGEAEGNEAATGKPGGPFDSWWALILACIGGGLFALAMPCTYPMIPITFSFFTKQAEARGGNVLPLALTYGAGIITIFVVVGVLAAQVIQPFVNHWATNLIIGAFFVIFAFALFGWINLQPPRFLQNAAGGAGRAGGLAGVFFMGAVLVITSFTCTAPIVGTLLASTAQYGSFRVGFGMAIFGLTMAIPFVTLALLPTKVKAMPKSGEWMNTLKVSLGFVELAAALKFISVVDIALGWQFLNRELYLALTATILLFWALFLFGFLPKKGESYAGVSASRQAIGMFVTLFAVYLFQGAGGQRMDFLTTTFIPPYHAEYVGPLAEGGGGSGGGTAKAKGHTIVKDDPMQAVQVAQADDKLLIYNFTGFN
ncbi:MAG: protein-disulfide reductase DsbD family protein [bacterium]|nr:protein-disulfide reductase DsbD family protein [bacterium]